MSNAETMVPRSLLHRQTREQRDDLERKTRQLELLADVGVAMAGSFDIGAILAHVRRAARELVRNGPVEVFYAGCTTINSKSRWLPQEPGSALLLAEERRRLEERVATEPSDPVESIASELLARDGSIAIPLAYKDELLGLVFLHTDEEVSGELAHLLSILSLSAATALRNIHLTQERIHFERLSAFGRMIGSVVHDFRSPLTALRGYAGMLSGLDLDPKERELYGSYVQEECNRLNAMIDEMLEFARGGHPDLELRAVPVSELLGSLASRVAAQFKDPSIHLRLELDYEGSVQADKGRMDRAIWNVVTNACQGLNGGGTIRVRTAISDARIVLEFADDGRGIPAEIRHRIFEPFFSYGKSESIGLGMAITRKIIEEHGGQISLESEPGVGTTVRFLLPLGEQE